MNRYFCQGMQPLFSSVELQPEPKTECFSDA